MRFAPTEEQVEFAAAVRALLEQRCTPADLRAAWSDAELAGGGPGGGDGRVRGAWSALAEMGVLGICVPETHGGLGMTDEDLTPILVEVGRAGLPDPVSSTAGVAAAVLRDHTASGLAARWLGPLAAGEVVAGVGFGATPTVTAATSVDLFVLCDRGEVHLVGPDAVELSPVDSVDGARRLARVAWTPSAATLAVGGGADEAAGHLAVNRAFDRAALGTSAMLVGLCRRMLDMTVQYAGERRQFGAPIGSFQAVKHHLADAGLALEFAEPLVLRAAHTLAHAAPDAESAPLGAPGAADEVAVHVSMAKAKVSAAADAVARAALQVHGAIGYTVEYDLHLYMKRAWALARRYGDAEFHRRRVRSALLG